MKISKFMLHIILVILSLVAMVCMVYTNHIIIALLNLICVLLNLYCMYDQIPYRKVLLVSNKRKKLNLAEKFISFKIYKRIHNFNVDTITTDQFLNDESIRNSKIQNNTDFLIDAEIPDELKQDIFKIFRSIDDIQ